jgi:ribonuclease BN (tRNA processing enzyme)
MDMTWTFLGSGGAFDEASRGHNNVLIEFDNGESYLLDCSLLALQALEERGDDPTDMDGVMLTHMHGDHDSGLESLGFRGYVLGEGKTFDLYTHPRLLPSRHERKFEDTYDLWEDRLEAGMTHMQDLQTGKAVRADLETFFDTRVSFQFELNGWGWSWIPTVHAPNKDSYGLYVESMNDDTSIFFSGDTRPLIQERPLLYEDADVIFHDCLFFDYYPDTIHTHIEEIRKMPKNVREKTYIMHHNGGELEKDDEMTIVSPNFRKKFFQEESTQ